MQGDNFDTTQGNLLDETKETKRDLGELSKPPEETSALTTHQQLEIVFEGFLEDQLQNIG